MKKRFFAAVVMALVTGLVILAAMDKAAYPIEPDNSNLAKEAAEYLSRWKPKYSESDIRLYDSVAIGNRKYTLMELGDRLGWISMTKGISGWYGIDGAGYGTQNFQEEIIEEKGKYHIVFGGRNAAFGIRSIGCLVDETWYTLEVPEGDRFIVSLELDAATKLPVDEVRFYDAAGTDITEQVPWN